MRNVKIGLLALSSMWTLGIGCSTSSSPELPGRTVVGRVVGADGKPVSGVNVLLGESTAKTDDKGRYSLATDTQQGVVRFEKSGFLTGLERVKVEKNFSVGLDVIMLRHGAKVTLDAEEGGEAAGPRGSYVRIPKNSLVDSKGSPVKGAVDVYITPIDPKRASELQAAPGDFVTEGDDGRSQLESFGMLDITIQKDDAKLNVADGEALEIKIPLPEGSEEPEEEMPLYSFHEERGVWVLEGSAKIAEDGVGYVGQIPHLSAWNIDKPYEATCVSGRVVDRDGNSVAGARIRGVGASYTGESTTTTDQDGRFALAVRRDSEVQVTAEHPLGGGRTRALTSGDAETEVPPAVGSEDCQDGGEWVIEEGTYVDPDGGSQSCPELAGLDLGGCMLEFSEKLGGCAASFTGECTMTVTEDGVSTEYENGSRYETSADGIAFYGTDGNLCYRLVTSSDGSTITYVFGDDSEYEVDLGQEGSEFVMTCPSGEIYDLTSQESAAIQACNPDSSTGGGDGTGGSSSSGGCKFVDMGGETIEGSMCTDNDDCTGADQICCDFTISGQAYNLCYTETNCQQLRDSAQE